MNTRLSKQEGMALTWGLGLVGVAMVVASGTLPWAIAGGVASGVLGYIITREWKSGLVAGGTVAIVILVFGILAMGNPG